MFTVYHTLGTSVIYINVSEPNICMPEDIFKIEPIKGEIKIDKRKTISPYNRIKNFKYADLPAQCNDCVYRSVDEGGNGKCTVYEKDAACAIRRDIGKFLEMIDTRNTEDVKGLLDLLAKMSLEQYLLAFAQGKLDGNVPDRNTRSETANIVSILKLLNEFNSKLTVTESKSFSKSGDLENLFRELKKE